MRMLRAALAILLGLAILLPASSGQAFNRSRDPQTQACLWWKTRQVEVYLNDVCSMDVAKASCENAVWSTLDQWNLPECSDFQFVAGGADGSTARTDVGFDQDDWDNNINLIIFQENTWIHERSAIALTTTTYDRLNGQIVDSDVEFNGVAFTFSTDDSGQVLMDIANTLAHEAGHMLGLDHSTAPDSSMWSTANEGETKKRDLDQDDIDGLCHVYPDSQSIPPCAGFTPPKDKNGCDCSSSSHPIGSFLLFFAAMLFFLRVRRTYPEA